MPLPPSPLPFTSRSNSSCKPRQDLGVGKRAQPGIAALQIDRRGTAPEAEVGMIGFARPIHPAAHHRDRNRIAGRGRVICANLPGQLDKGFVLHTGTTRATDDVRSVIAFAPTRRAAVPPPSRRDLLPGVDLLAFLRKRNRQRHADRVADAAGEQLLQSRRVLRMPSGGMPASVTPKCNGTSGRSAAKRRFTSTTFRGSESFSETQYRVKPSRSSSSQCSRRWPSSG